jgi:predicted RecB family nuclease
MEPNQPDQQGSDLPPRLASPAQRALANAGITSLEQLATYTEAQIAALHGIGPNALKQLRQALESRGLSFSTEP